MVHWYELSTYQAQQQRFIGLTSTASNNFWNLALTLAGNGNVKRLWIFYIGFAVFVCVLSVNRIDHRHYLKYYDEY